MIAFTQYLRPDGRPIKTGVERTQDVEERAQAFIDSGGWFEVEVLSTGHVSLTACYVEDGEQQDIDIEVIENGPGVGDAVDRLVSRVFSREAAR